jgi:hypothetical protein
MLLTEGGGSHQILLPDTHVVKIEKKDPTKAFGLISGVFDLQTKQSPFPELDIELISFVPNASEKLETWIKGDQLYLTGIPQGWKALHQKTTDITETAKKEYLKELAFDIKETKSGKSLYRGPFKSEFKFDFNNETPKLQIDTVEIALNGPEALLNHNTQFPNIGRASVTVDLEQKPKLLFLQDDLGDIHLFAFGPNGEIQKSIFEDNNLKSLIVYDRGFGGYSIQEKVIPLKSRKELDDEGYAIVEEELRRAIANEPQLSPPLEILKEACSKANSDFATTCKQFLVDWDKAGSWLYPKDGPEFSAEEFIEIPSSHTRGCEWADFLFDDTDPIQSLKMRGCPLPETEKPLTNLTQQIFAAGDQLPETLEGKVRNARLLSALFRAYEIHLNEIKPILPNELEPFTIEAPITLKQQEMIPSNKMEDNLPKATLKITKGNITNYISLVYNRTESGIKVPGLNGEYLFRLQPKSENIPYHLRLRQARQINYANSAQPFSYEGDLLITDRNTQQSVEKTISMNNVHETWEGYRFYLSNISPPAESAVKRVQLAVNHDPAKYFLTYPGGVIVALGSLLLFWVRTKGPKGPKLSNKHN